MWFPKKKKDVILLDSESGLLIVNFINIFYIIF